MTKRRSQKSAPKAATEKWSGDEDPLHQIARLSRVPIARVIEEHAERAAIREYLGGMSRQEAEAAAIDDAREMLEVTR